MEYIKKEELIIGKIYNCANIYGSKYIVKIPNDLYNSTNINKDVPRLYKMGNFTTETLQWSLATSEEKHWLESCVKLDKFITFEEATKTFNPEYVECIKEVIEPLPQFKVIETIETITKVENNEGNQFFIGDTVKIGPLLVVHNITGFKYNENKSKIMAITNYTSVGIDINKIEHYIKPKISLDDIKKRYPIGTFVKSVVSSKIIEIKDYNLFHSNTNGDVLSYNQGSIILYQNEIWAKEETLLEKAKRLYPIGTKYTPEPNNAYFNRIQSSTAIFEVRNQGIFCKNNLGWVFYKNKWAEIIE